MTWQTLDARFATAASVSLGFAAGGCYFLGAKALNLAPPRTERRFCSTEAGLSPSTGATFLLPAAAFSPRDPPWPCRRCPWSIRAPLQRPPWAGLGARGQANAVLLGLPSHIHAQGRASWPQGRYCLCQAGEREPGPGLRKAPKALISRVNCVGARRPGKAAGACCLVRSREWLPAPRSPPCVSPAPGPGSCRGIARCSLSSPSVLRLRLGPFRRSRLPTVSLAQRGSMPQDGTAEPTLAPCS